MGSLGTEALVQYPISVTQHTLKLGARPHRSRRLYRKDDRSMKHATLPVLALTLLAVLVVFIATITGHTTFVCLQG